MARILSSVVVLAALCGSGGHPWARELPSHLSMNSPHMRTSKLRRIPARDVDAACGVL